MSQSNDKQPGTLIRSVQISKTDRARTDNRAVLIVHVSLRAEKPT